jgi:cytochrome c oxidase assembly protein subunit 11
MAPNPMPADRLRRRNRRLGLGAAGFAAGMLGLAFAAVPLYRVFCQVTGYGGTVQAGGIAPGARPGAPAAVLTIRFVGSTHPGLPWQFRPAQLSVALPIGEEGVAFYTAANEATTPVTGIATYNVTPEVVGRYFHKTACFCFNEQTLAPGEQAEMPLSFWVDPALLDDPNTRDIRTITVGYTFFRTLEDAARSGALASAGPHVGAAGRNP